MRAKEILRYLADGVGPYTGAPLPQSSPYQQAETVRALGIALRAMDAYTRRLAREARLPSHAGKPWTSQEEQTLIKEFRQGRSVQELSDLHKRTEGAITSRLTRLGLLEAREPDSTEELTHVPWV